MPQSVHDWLVDRLAERKGFSRFARDNGYEIAKNYTDKKTRHIGNDDDRIWPDIIVYDPKTKGQPAKRIGEVEIEDTVTIDHAKGHWDVYVRRVSDFILAVPKSSAKDANEILGDLKVACKLWLYEVKRDEQGKPVDVEFL